VELEKTKAKSQPDITGGAGALQMNGAASLVARTPSSGEVRAQLDKILQAGALARANRTRKLLEYIVEQSLAGNARRLKQYSIATEALGRGSDFDPDTDPIVRLEASKLRRALEDYYLRSKENDPIRISVPKGSYVPAFELIDRDGDQSVQPDTGVSALSVNSLSVQRLLILPLQAPHRNDVNRAITDGLFEQLDVELARYNEISLVTPPYMPDGAALDPIGAGQKAQARFVLSGSVRQSGDDIRITIRLHDVRAGSIIWVECFDLDAAGGLNLKAEDTIARHVAGAVADYYGVISHTLSLQSVYCFNKPWNLQDTILRHRYLARTLTDRVYRIARADLESGTSHAPFHPIIWAALAHTIFYGNALGFDDDENWLGMADHFVQRAFELDHKCALGHVVMALRGLYRRETAEVLETCKRIMQYNSHAPSTKLSAGFFSALAGDWDAGSAMMNSAMAMLLHPPGWAYRVTFLNQFRQKNYLGALSEIGKYHAPENFTPPLLRAAALSELGRMEEASAAVAEVLRISPGFPKSAPRYFRYLSAFDEISDPLMNALHRAGLRFDTAQASA
jgi:adenylate cyclase